MLKEMYTRMLRSRSVTNALEGASSGSEAVTVGIGLELKSSDSLCASRHQLLQYISSIAHGTEQYATCLKLVLGHADAALPLCIPPEGPSIIFPDADGQAQIAVAIGAAHTFRSFRHPHVSVVLAGSLATGLLSAYEAARFAGQAKLPVVFAFETRIDPQHAEDHAHPLLRGEDLGFPRIPVDGNDGVAVHRVATEAIQRARQGDGPTLIECQVAHRQTPDSLGLAEDPIDYMRQYLQKHQLWSDEWNANLELEVERLRDQLTGNQTR
jgi:pyruvate dehydrogenase E1 component alpha subunit